MYSSHNNNVKWTVTIAGRLVGNRTIQSQSLADRISMINVMESTCILDLITVAIKRYITDESIDAFGEVAHTIADLVAEKIKSLIMIPYEPRAMRNRSKIHIVTGSLSSALQPEGTYGSTKARITNISSAKYGTVLDALMSIEIDPEMVRTEQTSMDFGGRELNTRESVVRYGSILFNRHKAEIDEIITTTVQEWLTRFANDSATIKNWPESRTMMELYEEIENLRQANWDAIEEAAANRGGQ